MLPGAFSSSLLHPYIYLLPSSFFITPAALGEGRRELYKMAKTKWKKIIVAGPLVIETIYPAVTSRSADHVRAEKRKLSSEAQQRMNMIYSKQKLKLMLAANFVRGDLVCTFTYDDAHLPASRKAAEGKLKYFRAKLSANRKKHGKELLMVWNTESKHGDGRYHHHAVINATGDDYNLILKLWGQGEVHIRPLRIDAEKNYASLAAYMCKERAEKVGQRSWSYTRNCHKPEVETFRVESDTQLQPPKGALILGEVTKRNTYGSFRWLEYIVNKAPRGKRARRRAQKRKH